MNVIRIRICVLVTTSGSFVFLQYNQQDAPVISNYLFL